MVGHFGFMAWIYVPSLFLQPWFQLVLATPVQVIIGGPFYRGAYKALRSGSANMDVLISLGTSAAYLYSLYQTITLQPSHGAMGMDEPRLYYETSAVLITLVVMGKLLEALAKGRTSEAIKSLMGLQAENAIVLRDGVEIALPLAQVAAGDLVRVRPGGKIPVDGAVEEGSSAVDESMLTERACPYSRGREIRLRERP